MTESPKKAKHTKIKFDENFKVNEALYKFHYLLEYFPIIVKLSQ